MRITGHRSSSPRRPLPCACPDELVYTGLTFPRDRANPGHCQLAAMLVGAAVGALLVRRSVALTLALAGAVAGVCTFLLWRADRARP